MIYNPLFYQFAYIIPVLRYQLLEFVFPFKIDRDLEFLHIIITKKEMK